MQYRLELKRPVRRQIDLLPGNIRQRVRRVIAELASNPRPITAKPMEDELEGMYRIRVDDYRIIYTVYDEIVTVEVIRVVQRSPRTYQDLA